MEWLFVLTLRIIYDTITIKNGRKEHLSQVQNKLFWNIFQGACFILKTSMLKIWRHLAQGKNGAKDIRTPNYVLEPSI